MKNSKHMEANKLICSGQQRNYFDCTGCNNYYIIDFSGN